MSTQDEASELFKKSSILAFVSKSFSICCLLIPIILLFVSKDSIFYRFFVLIQCSFTITYVLLELVDRHWFFFVAEDLRRKLWIDNGFNSHVTSKTTDNYFNNPLKPSFLRLTLNSYENCFFTFEILKYQSRIVLIKIFLSVVIWCIVCLCSIDYKIIAVIVQSIFSARVLYASFEHFAALFRLKHIKEIFYNEFFAIGIKNKEQLYVLFNCIFDYECLKSYSHLRLDSRVFDKLNPKLSRKWDELIKKLPPVNAELLKITFPL